jgi:hypothetical protein
MCVRGVVRGKGIGYPVGANTPFEEILMKRKLNLALWIVAGILAVVFLVASSTKLFVPKEKLAGMGGAASRWVEDFSPVPSRPSEPSSSRDSPSIGRSVLRVTRSLTVCATLGGASSDDRVFPD